MDDRVARHLVPVRHILLRLCLSTWFHRLLSPRSPISPSSTALLRIIKKGTQARDSFLFPPSTRLAGQARRQRKRGFEETERQKKRAKREKEGGAGFEKGQLNFLFLYFFFRISAL